MLNKILACEVLTKRWVDCPIPKTKLFASVQLTFVQEIVTDIFVGIIYLFWLCTFGAALKFSAWKKVMPVRAWLGPISGAFICRWGVEEARARLILGIPCCWAIVRVIKAKTSWPMNESDFGQESKSSGDWCDNQRRFIPLKKLFTTCPNLANKWN